MAATKAQPAKPVIAHVHGFRGFAILSIVAGHALSDQVYFFGGSEPSPSVAALCAVVEAIFHGGTIYFALISGLLFSLVLHTKGWPAFFRSKLTNVLSPYVVMTFFFTWYGHDDQFRLRVFEGSVQEYLGWQTPSRRSGWRPVSRPAPASPQDRPAVEQVPRELAALEVRLCGPVPPV